MESPSRQTAVRAGLKRACHRHVSAADGLDSRRHRRFMLGKRIEQRGDEHVARKPAHQIQVHFQ
jgi:hypothetical protein